MADATTGGDVASEQPVTGSPSPSLRFVSVDARAQGSDFGAQLGEGFQSLGRGLESASNTLEDISQKRDELWAQQISSKAEVDWRQNMAQAEQDFTNDPSKGTNYASTYKNSFNAYQENILAQNPDITDNAKNLVMTRLNSLGANMFGEALRLQSKANTDWGIQSATDTLNNYKQLANAPGAWVGVKEDGSPDTSYFDDIREKGTQTLSSTLLPTRMRKDLLVESHLDTDESEIATSADQKGPIQTAQWIRQGYLGTSLTIPQRFMKIDELERQGKMQAETNLQSTSKDLETFITGVKMGAVNANDPRAQQLISAYASANGDLKDVHEAIAQNALKSAAKEGFEQMAVNSFPVVDKGESYNDVNSVARKASQIGGNIIPYDVDAVTSNYGISKANPYDSAHVQIKTAQEASQQAQTIIKNAELTGVARQKMLSMTPQQASDYYTGLQNTMGADHPALKDIAAFETQRQKLLQSDSAKVALADDTILQKNQNAETITQNFLNPSPLKVGLRAQITQQQVQGANHEAISSMYAFQDQVGAPHAPLTQQKAQFLADSFKQASARSPEQAIQLKSQLKKAYSPDDLSDVVKAIPLDTKLSLFMGLPSGSQQERNFAESLAVGDKDKSVGTKTKETLDKAFDPSIDSSMSNFLQSQISNGYTGTILKNSVTDMQGALRDYASVLAIKNKSNDIDSAIKQAPQDVLGTLFVYTNINKQTVAIPRSNGQGGMRSDTDISNISQGLQLETNNIFSGSPNRRNTPDFTDKFNTKLTSEEESKFQVWKQKYAPNDSGFDYDLRGAFKAGVTPDGERGHFPDTFKKPNHPTFSNESQYNGGQYQGGSWGENDSFKAGSTNLQYHGTKDLQEYFNKVEPNSKLDLGEGVQKGQDIDLTGALDRYNHQDPNDNHKMAINDLKQNAYWTTGIKGLTKDNEAVLMGFDNLGNRFPILDKQGLAITRDLDMMGDNFVQKIKHDTQMQLNHDHGLDENGKPFKSNILPDQDTSNIKENLSKIFGK